MITNANSSKAKRLHVKIEDTPLTAYQVPNSVFTRPETDGVSAEDADLATLLERADQVDDLEAGLEHLDARLELEALLEQGPEGAH